MSEPAGPAPASPGRAPSRPTPRWWGLPLAVLTVCLAIVTWSALRAFADDPGFLPGLRLVIEGIATGFLSWATWNVAAGRSGGVAPRRSGGEGR